MNDYLKLSIIAFICFPYMLFSQCEDGSENSCACETADVFLTADDLNGYAFSMSPFFHPEDGPFPMCPGPDCSCIPDNPNWIAFVAWEDTISMGVQYFNCETGPGPNSGIQVAVYASCGPNYEIVECNVSANDCDSIDPKELFLSDLIVGDVYFILIDGCSGAYCDIVLDVDITSDIDSYELSNNINVYPNPSTSLVHIDFEKNSNGEGIIRLIDANGKVYMSKHKDHNESAVTLDLFGLTAGIYFIEIKLTSDYVHYKRLFVMD